MPTHRFASLRGALGNRLAALAAAGTMRAIREGMLWLMPCLLTSAAFQTYSPLVDSLSVKRRGDVRKAKLYYLRELSGKAARIKEKLS